MPTMGSYYQQVWEKIIKVEAKTYVIWGEGHTDTVYLNIYSHLFFLFFQGPLQSGRQAG